MSGIIYRENVLIRTDHASLLWLKNFKDPEGIARCLSVLYTFDLTVQYRKGSLHTNVDDLSRVQSKQGTVKDSTVQTVVFLLLTNVWIY